MRAPEKKTIGELLSGRTRFVIPDYQRAYDWKADTQLKDLFLDLLGPLEETDEEDSQLFLGTMLFDFSSDRTFSDIDSVDIIDGQQRLTTIMILLIACRQYASSVLNNQQLVTACQKAIDAGDEIIINPEPKLIASVSVRLVYENMCNQEWDGTFPDTLKGKGVVYHNRRVRPIYNACLKEIRQFSGEGSEDKFRKFLSQLLYNTIIIQIGIEKQSEAFEIFERTNARGKELAVEDLLKNFLYSKDSTAEISTRDAWETISHNAGTSMLRMLKYFWNSRGGYTSTKALYRKLKKYHGKITTDQFVEELLEFSLFYKAYMDKEKGSLSRWLKRNIGIKDSMYLSEIERAVNALKLFKVTQVTPLVYSLMTALKNEGLGSTKTKRAISFLRLIESYHFVNNKVCNRVGNEVEKLYQQYSQKFYVAEDSGLLLTELSRTLLDKIAHEDEFVAAFKNLSYIQSSDKPVIKYTFDKIVNVGVKPGQRKNLIDFNELFSGVKPAFDIEHIHPQGKSDVLEEWIHETGNLTVISRQINGILGDKSVNEKIDILLNPSKYKNNIKHVDDYLKETMEEISTLVPWDASNVRGRTKKLAHAAYSAAVSSYAY